MVVLHSEKAIAKRVIVLGLVLILCASTFAGAYYFSLLSGSDPLPNVEPPDQTPSPEEQPKPFPPQEGTPSDAESSNSTTPPAQAPHQPPQVLEEIYTFFKAANATLGNWSASVSYTPKSWAPGVQVKLNVSLSFSNELFASFKPPLLQTVSYVCMLVTS